MTKNLFLPKVTVFLVLLCIIVNTLHSQHEKFYENWRWAHFTTNTGLPSNRIDDLVETKNGIVWVSTEEGLAWYDGFRWHTVTPADGLPKNRATKICEGPRNTVLVLLNDTLYQGDTKGFKKIILPNRKVVSVCEYDSNSILISTVHDKETILIYREGHTEIFIANVTVGFLHRTRSGKIWYATAYGLSEIIDRTLKSVGPFGVIRCISDNNSNDGVFANDVPSDKIGVWTWYKNGRMSLSSTERMHPVRSLDISSTGDVIIVYETGEIHVRKKYVSIDLNPIPSQMVDVTFVEYSQDDNLWVGTERGLYLFRATAKKWAHWGYGFSDPKNIIMEIYQVKNGDIWIGNFEGVEIRHVNGTVSRISKINNNALGLITGINQDTQGNVWICSGSSFEGAYRWDGKRWDHFGNKDGLSSPRVHKIKKDNNGRLWFLGLGKTGNSTTYSDADPGAFMFDGTTFKKICTDDGLLHNRVYSFVQSKSGALWFGTRNGLSRFHDGSWKHWGYSHFTPSRTIYSLAVDTNDNIWFSNFASKLGYIGTDDSVYWVWNWVAGSLYQQKVWDISVDKKGIVWAATTKGLFSYRDSAWSNYNLESGSRLKELRSVLPLKDKIYVGGHGTGVWILDRNEIGFPIKIEIAEPIIESEKVRLRWTADAYWGAIRSEDIEIRYRLNAGNWSEWSKSREVIIPDLPDGSHTFEVQAKDHFGNIREETGTAAFLIPPPFFKQPLYIVPLALLLTAIAYLISRNIAAKMQHVRVLHEQRTRIAHDLHDEVGSNLGSIALISQRIGRSPHVPESVKQELSVIAKTAIQTAEDLRDIVWYTNPKNDTMVNLETRLREIAGIMLPNVPIEFTTHDTVGSDVGLIEIRRSILYMYKEILHNILKHSKATKVMIHFDRRPRQFALSIRDNGKGFQLREEIYGNGLRSLYKRANEIGALVDIQTKKGEGTMIGIVFKNHVNT